MRRRLHILEVTCHATCDLCHRLRRRTVHTGRPRYCRPSTGRRSHRGPAATRPGRAAPQDPAIPARSRAEHRDRTHRTAWARGTTPRAPWWRTGRTAAPPARAGASRARKVRDDDCAGPTNRREEQPEDPEHGRARDEQQDRARRPAARPARPMITAFGPIRSSSRPADQRARPRTRRWRPPRRSARRPCRSRRR